MRAMQCVCVCVYEEEVSPAAKALHTLGLAVGTQGIAWPTSSLSGTSQFLACFLGLKNSSYKCNQRRLRFYAPTLDPRLGKPRLSSRL